MSALIQAHTDLLTVDASTTVVDPLFATLLSVPIVTVGGDLLVWFTGSIDVVNTGQVTGVEFRVVLDGTARSATGVCVFLNLTSAPRIATCITNVARGAHTVAIEWGLVPGAPATTVRCRPATLPNRDHASLVVVEVLQ